MAVLIEAGILSIRFFPLMNTSVFASRPEIDKFFYAKQKSKRTKGFGRAMKGLKGLLFDDMLASGT